MLGHSALSELPLSTQSSSSVSVSVSGQTITVSPTFVSGAVTADANVTAVIYDRAASGIVDRTGSLVRTRFGEILGVTVTLVDGSVTIGSGSSDANVSGQTLTVSPTLVSGSVTADANVGGQTVTVTPTLVSGSVAADANVGGQTLTVTPVLVDGAVSAGGSVSVSGDTITVTPVLVDGTVTTTSASTVTKPPGGDDAPPRGHYGAQPRLVKAKPRRKPIEAEELETLYDRILGIEPQTKAERKAVKAAVRAVERHAEVSQPEAFEVDWISLQNDLNAVLALRAAYEKLVEDEDEEALIAILMAA